MNQKTRTRLLSVLGLALVVVSLPSAASAAVNPPPGGSPNAIAAEGNADGRLELMGVNTHLADGQNNIFYKSQISPDGAWSGWSRLNGYLTGIALARGTDGRLEAIGVNSHVTAGHNNVFYAYQTTPSGTWSGWHSLGGYLTRVAAERDADGGIVLLGVNAKQPDGQSNIYRTSQASVGGSWSAWQREPGYLTTIAMAQNSDGLLEAFGANGHIAAGNANVFYSTQNSVGGSWSGWTSFINAGYVTSLAAETNLDGRIELIGANAKQPDGKANVFNRWQVTAGGSSWSGWHSMGGYLTTVAVARNQDGRLEAFGANVHIPDGHNDVFYAEQSSPGVLWGAWHSIDGYLG